MNIPIATFPSRAIRHQISGNDFKLYVDSCDQLMSIWLNASDQNIVTALKDNSSVIDFLTSLLDPFFKEPFRKSETSNAQLNSLSKRSMQLALRIISISNIPFNLVGVHFLSRLCAIVHEQKKLKELLCEITKSRFSDVEPSLGKYRELMFASLDSNQFNDISEQVKDLIHIIRIVPKAAISFMMSFELIESVAAKYTVIPMLIQRALSVFIYQGFISLIRLEKPNYSVFLDHLYGIKDMTGASEGYRSFLADLMTMTPLLLAIRKVCHLQKSERARNLLKYMQTYVEREKFPGYLTAHDKTSLENGDEAEDPFKMSLVSQVEDLVPGVRSDFILKLLKTYNDDVEAVIAHILESPSGTNELDKPLKQSNDLQIMPMEQQKRLNIHDGDLLDTLSVSESQLHQGRAQSKDTADDLLLRPDAGSKSAILAALATFDADDDERDDTYDNDDVGAPDPDTDIAVETRGQSKFSENIELTLLNAYDTQPGTFSRDSSTRRSTPRRKLRDQTGLDDEMIEGWAIMLAREPKRLRFLHQRTFETGSMNQNSLPRTAWSRNDESGSSSEQFENQGTRQFANTGSRWANATGGSNQGHGHAGRGGRIGADNGNSTPIARQRKEASKASRANHNRRDQRLKKMNRGN